MRKLYLLLLPVLLFATCNDDNGVDNPDDNATSQFSVPQESLAVNFGDKPGVSYFTVLSNRNFKAVPDEKWCTVNVVPYAYEYNVEVIVPENPDATKRTAKVTVTCEGFSPVEISVTQLGKSPDILVKETEVIITKENLSFTLEVTSNIETEFDLPEWIKQIELTRANETNVYNFVAQALPETDFKREGIITVKAADPEMEETPGELSVEVPVIQYGNEPVIAPEEIFVSITGSQFDFSIRITANMEIAFELPEWIEQTTPPSPAPDTYYFTAKALPAGTNSRQDDILIKAMDASIAVEPVKVTVRQVGDISLETPRFAVISDIHHGRSNSKTKVTSLVRNIASIEPKVDAIFVVGDITDWGKEEQYDELLSVWQDPAVISQDLPVYFMMGNHDNFGFSNDVTQSSELFKQKLGYDNIHTYVEIKGHSFICVSEQGSFENDYYDAEINFIKEGLVKSSTNFPGKPVFLFVHVGVLDTAYGTERNLNVARPWGTDSYKSALTGHPEIFLFSGHSHYPLSDPRSIHQRDFTAVNDGTSSYGEIENGYSEGINPPGSEETTEGVIVTVQPNGDVLLERWDTYRNEKIAPDWLIEAPHDGSRFKYTDALRDKNAAPEFTGGAAVTVTDVGKRMAGINFPTAVSTDPDYSKVFMYEVKILENGQLVDGKVFTKYSEIYLNSAAPNSFKVSFDGLTPGATYTAQVVALDSYGHRSQPITSAEFTMEGTVLQPVTDVPRADLLDVVFNDKGAYDRSVNKYSITTGATLPATSFNANANTFLATFPGSSSCFYKFDYEEDEEFKAELFDGFTLETYYMTTSTGTHAPSSSQETGGFGFESEGGKMVYWIRNGSGSGSWVKPTGQNAIVANTYYHLVATFDGAQTKLFVNGILEDTKVIEGLTLAAATAQWLGIGGDGTLAERGVAQSSLNGNVAFTRMYKDALDAEDVAKLYQQTQYRELGVGNASELSTFLTTTLPSKAAANPSQAAAINATIAEGWEVMNSYNSAEADFTAMINKCKVY